MELNKQSMTGRHGNHFKKWPFNELETGESFSTSEMNIRTARSLCYQYNKNAVTYKFVWHETAEGVRITKIEQ